MDQNDPIFLMLQEGIQSRIFPGAVLFIRQKGRVRFHQGVGFLSDQPDSSSVAIQTVYDLASLTKPLATASGILLLVQEGVLNLGDTLETLLDETKGTPLGRATLRSLLAHQSGLPAWRPYYRDFPPVFTSRPQWRRDRVQAFLNKITHEPLEQSSELKSVYSDLGYMLLGFVVERAITQPFDDFCQSRLFDPLQAMPLSFRASKGQGVLAKDHEEIAPTEMDSWRGKLCQGEVHDENAFALGGIAGHAGLFGTAEAIGRLTKVWLDSYLGRPSFLDSQIVKEFCAPQPHTSWGLGWDTPSQPSSSGKWFSPESFGHLGFTGTSIWVDPPRELEVIFLSNRVHPTRENNAIKAFRPRLHDVIIRECHTSS